MSMKYVVYMDHVIPSSRLPALSAMPENSATPFSPHRLLSPPSSRSPGHSTALELGSGARCGRTDSNEQAMCQAAGDSCGSCGWVARSSSPDSNEQAMCQAADDSCGSCGWVARSSSPDSNEQAMCQGPYTHIHFMDQVYCYRYVPGITPCPSCPPAPCNTFRDPGLPIDRPVQDAKEVSHNQENQQRQRATDRHDPQALEGALLLGAEFSHDLGEISSALEDERCV